MSQDLESLFSTSKKDSFLGHLWRSFLESDFILAKPSYMHRLLMCVLFGVGIVYILFKSNPSYLINETRASFQHGAAQATNLTPPNNSIAIWGVDNNTQIRRNEIIGGNLRKTVASPQPIDTLQYQNMSATWHRLNDEELRQKASTTPTKSRGSKIAFMFIIKDSLPFAPLWKRYFRGHEYRYSIYIHSAPNYIPSLDTTSPFFGRFIPSKVAEWGRVSLQEAENRLLFNALLDETNSWFVLLSESCIPIENFANTYQYITESSHNFVMSFQESKALHGTRLRRGRHWEMAPAVTSDNFRKGSQWFQINRDLAMVVANDATYYPKFANSFCQPHPVCYIDEHYLPTLSFVTRSEALASRILTYFLFHRNSPHPNKWDHTNTHAQFIKRIRDGHTCIYNGLSTSRCYFFARKFDPSALPSLLELACDIMGIP